MAFGIAETVATIHASMAAIESYIEHREPRDQVIQTLNLEYNPTQYSDIESRLLAVARSKNLEKAYKDLFDATGERVTQCFEEFAKAIRDDQLPDERDRLGKSARKCVCAQIKVLKDFIGGQIPDELENEWRERHCKDFYPLRP